MEKYWWIQIVVLGPYNWVWGFAQIIGVHGSLHPYRATTGYTAD